jgi:uncharacterized Ntn-hydrolase superfamily protein
VVVQAHGWLHWRPAMLDLLGRGLSAVEVVEMLTVLPGARESQFAAVAPDGEPSVFTGPDCTGHAGHAVGDGVAVQANTMVSDQVWPAMLAGFQEHIGALEYRLVAALEAADEVGGDYRGRQSAAVQVVSGTRGYESTGDADDSPWTCGWTTPPIRPRNCGDCWISTVHIVS